MNFKASNLTTRLRAPLFIFSIIFLSGVLTAHGFEAEKLSKEEAWGLSVAEAERIVWEKNLEFCEEFQRAKARGILSDPNKLSDAEYCALQGYTGIRYSQINPALEGSAKNPQAMNGADWLYVRVLDAALQKIPAEGRATVYRGTSSKAQAFNKPGEIVELKGYTSTSQVEGVAYRFATDRVLVIDSVSARSVSAYSSAGQEVELILPRGTQLRFERAEKKKVKVATEEGSTTKTVQLVYLTEVPSGRNTASKLSKKKK